jgi:TolB-like protein/Tfp pilus assembly protein PilF
VGGTFDSWPEGDLGPMTNPDIFLSYNREDAATAKRFADAFSAEGLNVWWDTALRSGEAYDEVTEAALRGAKAVVVLWSPRSVVSRWVRAEATIADRCKTLVPVTIEACERPIMFELTQTADLTHWTGDAADPAWLAFLSDVRRFVGREAMPTPPQSTTSPEPSPAQPGKRGDAPSLAILPFTNRSCLAEDEVFAFGMVEDLIEALSHGANIRVLASSTMARFRTGAVIDLSAMAAELGVRYILEGNVRRFENDLRVTAQVVRAEDGAIAWTEKFDRPLSELAGLQDDLVREVASQLGGRVYQLELERVLEKPSNHTAWEAAMRSLACFYRASQLNLAEALAEAERAVTIAPDYGLAHAMVAHAKSFAYFILSPDDPEQIREIRASAETAVRLAPSHALTLMFAGQSCCNVGLPSEGLHLAERALKASSRVVEGHYTCGLARLMLNQWDDAIAHLKAEIDITPGNHIEYGTRCVMALAYLAAGQLDEAQVEVSHSLLLYPDFPITLLINAVLASMKNRENEARDTFMRVRNSGFIPNLAMAEQPFRRVYRGHPIELEVLPHVRALWTETEGST